jgi:calcineurin-like phosphoesterase family protein
MRVWFTADLHLGHANIVRFCERPFLSPQEQELLRQQGQRGKWRISQETVPRHDDGLIEAINECAEPGDMLWILGDFCWGGLVEAAAYRERIRCRNLFFVWGNHDHPSIRPIFTEAIEQGMIEIEGQPIWLNHYPMRSWNRSFHGSWHLYGHGAPLHGVV